MHRITISLPTPLALAVEREAKRCGTSVSALTREALEVRLGLDGRRFLPLMNLGRSGKPGIAHRIDEVLAEEWLKP